MVGGLARFLLYTFVKNAYVARLSSLFNRSDTSYGNEGCGLFVCLFVVFDVVLITLSCVYFLHFIFCSLTFRDRKQDEFVNSQESKWPVCNQCDYVFGQLSYMCLIYMYYSGLLGRSVGLNMHGRCSIYTVYTGCPGGMC